MNQSPSGKLPQINILLNNNFKDKTNSGQKYQLLNFPFVCLTSLLTFSACITTVSLYSDSPVSRPHYNKGKKGRTHIFHISNNFCQRLFFTHKQIIRYENIFHIWPNPAWVAGCWQHFQFYFIFLAIKSTVFCFCAILRPCLPQVLVHKWIIHCGLWASLNIFDQSNETNYFRKARSTTRKHLNKQKLMCLNAQGSSLSTYRRTRSELQASSEKNRCPGRKRHIKKYIYIASHKLRRLKTRQYYISQSFLFTLIYLYPHLTSLLKSLVLHILQLTVNDIPQ